MATNKRSVPHVLAALTIVIGVFGVEHRVFARFCGMEMAETTTWYCVTTCDPNGCVTHCEDETTYTFQDKVCDDSTGSGPYPGTPSEPPPACPSCCSGNCGETDPNEEIPPEPNDPGVDTDDDGIGDCVRFVLGSDSEEGVSKPLGDEWGGSGEDSCHSGVDVDCPNEDDPVYALQDGRVSFAGGDVANQVIIVFTDPATGDTWNASYGHLNNVNVTNGDLVSAGTEIGLCGDQGTAPGNFHVHYRIYRGLGSGQQSPAPECDGDGNPPDDFFDATGWEVLNPEVVHGSCP